MAKERVGEGAVGLEAKSPEHGQGSRRKVVERATCSPSSASAEIVSEGTRHLNEYHSLVLFFSP